MEKLSSERSSNVSQSYSEKYKLQSGCESGSVWLQRLSVPSPLEQHHLVGMSIAASGIHR